MGRRADMAEYGMALGLGSAVAVLLIGIAIWYFAIRASAALGGSCTEGGWGSSGCLSGLECDMNLRGKTADGELLKFGCCSKKAEKTEMRGSRARLGRIMDNDGVKCMSGWGSGKLGTACEGTGSDASDDCGDPLYCDADTYPEGGSAGDGCCASRTAAENLDKCQAGWAAMGKGCMGVGYECKDPLTCRTNLRPTDNPDSISWAGCCNDADTATGGCEAAPKK